MTTTDSPPVFRAMWPIQDPAVAALLAEAQADLRRLTLQANAVIDPSRGRYSIARAATVPGSGNSSELVLLYEAPAQPRAPRPYHRKPTR